MGLFIWHYKRQTTDPLARLEPRIKSTEALDIGFRDLKDLFTGFYILHIFSHFLPKTNIYIKLNSVHIKDVFNVSLSCPGYGYNLKHHYWYLVLFRLSGYPKFLTLVLDEDYFSKYLLICCFWLNCRYASLVKII